MFSTSSNGVGFNLNLASGTSELNVGDYATGYSQSDFNFHGLSSGPQTGWNVGI